MEIEKLPNDLEDAVEILTVFFSNDIEEISKMNEEEFISSSHFGAGMFIRNSWQLWWHENHKYEQWSKEMPKLNEWFNSIGITHADDMSSIILTCFYRNIAKKDYGLKTQVKKYHKHWKEQGYADGIPKH